MARKTESSFDELFFDNNIGSEGVSTLRISEIEPNKNQPRKSFNNETLKQLADSITEHGVLQPLIVRSIAAGNYMIIAGERRWRAAKMAGLSEIPVIIRDDLSDEQAMQIAMIENLQRENLNPIEEALGYKELIDRFGMTQDKLAQVLGKARSSVANSLGLLALPNGVQELLRNGSLSAGHCKALKKVKDAALMTLAEMNAPEAEPIFEKLLQKYKKSYAEIVATSSGKTCTEFVRKHLLGLLDAVEHAVDDIARLETASELVNSAAILLRNKTELDDVFLKLSSHPELSVNVNPKNSCRAALENGILGKNGAAVCAQINRLYEKAPDVFYRPKAYADFIEHPEKEPVVPDSEFEHYTLIGSISYVPLLGSYFFTHLDSMKFPLQPLFKRLPEWMLNYIRTRGDLTEKLFHDIDAPKRADMVKKAEKLGFKGNEKKDALKVAFESVCRPIDNLSSTIWRNLLPYCAKEDYERIRAAGTYLAKKCMNSFCAYGVISQIEQINPDIPSAEFADILNTFVINSIKVNNSANRFLLYC